MSLPAASVPAVPGQVRKDGLPGAEARRPPASRLVVWALAGLVALEFVGRLDLLASWVMAWGSCRGMACPEVTRTYQGLVLVVVGVAFGWRKLVRLRLAVDERWLTGGLVAAGIGVSASLVALGNWQFGGYDQSLAVDVGWRIHSGQRPYADFICTVPPGFYLGAAWAFRLFGATWSGMLVFTALFAGGAFLWMGWLLGRLLPSRALAWFTALLVLSGTMVAGGAWWHHNPVTALSAAIFLLSALLHLDEPESWPAGVSLMASLGLILLMKPNTALPLACGAILCCLAGSARPWRSLGWMVAGLTLTVMLLAGHGVSLHDVAQSYRAAAAGRANPLAMVGPRAMRAIEILVWLAWLVALLQPAVVWWQGLRAALTGAGRGTMAKYGLLGLGPAVGALAMSGNVDVKYVDMALFVVAGVVLLFGQAGAVWRGSPAYLTVLVSLLAACLYSGLMRQRIEVIGHRAFYEWHDSGQRNGNAFFADLRSGPRLAAALAEVKQVLDHRPGGAVFLGPRMEFGYAAFRLESPRGLPIWWHPGSSFALADEELVLRRWEAHRFGLAIYLKNDLIYQPAELRALLAEHYERDDSHPNLTVFRRRAGELRRVSSIR